MSTAPRDKQCHCYREVYCVRSASVQSTISHVSDPNITIDINYTRRQINLYRMFFADFSVNSQPILMKFCKDYFRVTRQNII